MHRSILLIFLFCLSSIMANPEFDDYLANNSFKKGEFLKYSVHYGWISGGEATINLIEEAYKGKKVFHAKAIAKTVGVVDKLFDVYDVYESYFDKNTGLPYKAIRDVHENKYVRYNEVEFDQHNKILMSKKSGEHKMPSKMLDLVSAFYFARRAYFDKMKVGESITIPTYFMDEYYPLKIKLVGYDNIKAVLGKVKCMRFKPMVEAGSVFEEEDDLTIWITNDKNHLPVLVEMEMLVGSVKCDLIECKGLKYNYYN